jgi:gentisate 1,2-dioxygenase
VRGSGTTVVDGDPYEWTAGDFLAIKPWAWHEHIHRGTHEAELFQVNDIPAMSALGYYFEEAYAGNGGHQKLA